jgi:Major Facilitator Superfamily
MTTAQRLPASDAPDAPGPTAVPPGPVTAERPRLTALVRASGGSRYAAALLVDSLGSGMLRPFLLLYGVQVLHLGLTLSGTAMSLGMLAGLVAVPFAGRWIDRGARSAAMGATMLVRVLGAVTLLAVPALGGSPLWGFTLTAVLLGIGNQCLPPAHAAVVTTLAEPRYRDAALATARSLRNAGLGVGALVAMAGTAGGPGGLRTLAALTALGYALAAALVLSMRVRSVTPAVPTTVPATVPATATAAPHRPARGRLTVLDVANLPYAFCFNVLEVALPAFLVTRLHVAPGWSAGIFVGNTVLVVATQLAAVMWMSRYARRSSLAVSGVVLAASYLGFWAAGTIGGWGAAAGVAAVSVLYTAGEIIYTGSATALIVATTDPARLGAALARFQLSSGIGLAASPAILTTLLAHGPGPLWASLAASTLLAAAAVRHYVPADRA